LTSKRSSIHDTAGGWRSCVHPTNSGEFFRTAFTSPSSEGIPFSAQRSEHGAEQHPSIWWQALYSRDQRFDGRFFIGAATTKIYCRPICPVPFARPINLVWFASAAAAGTAGYRPCRRCRPEASPGTPAWLGTSAIVSRALRLISEGALDESSVEDLACRVGVGSRQLRRLFVEHLGASPVKIAITHRVQFARNLIEETDLPITKIALSAGFTSIRQFNHAVRTVCGQSPTELRHAGAEFPASSQRGLVIRLPYRPPFDWPALVNFLRPRATPGVESVEDGVYRRTISLGDATGIIDVRPAKTDPALLVRIELPGYQLLMKVVERVRRIFDLGADPLRIAEDLSRDQRLKPLLDRRPGLRVPGAWDGFELAVHAILGQQLTAIDSSTVAGRLVQCFGKPLQTSLQGLTHLFPKPEDLVDADLSRVGILGARAATLHTLARAVCNEEPIFAASMTLEEAISRICNIPGIGENTAHYIAMRALGEPDAFPFADPGLLSALGSGGNPASPQEALRIAEGWRPWRSYAAMHLCAAATGNRAADGSRFASA
jgi:AraC family transcriptional regulator, regulatory protein of adaptative response / DNA-3-methyladenine glycosylase II